jgi:hypothetical protein
MSCSLLMGQTNSGMLRVNWMPMNRYMISTIKSGKLKFG